MTVGGRPSYTKTSCTPHGPPAARGGLTVGGPPVVHEDGLYAARPPGGILGSLAYHPAE